MFWRMSYSEASPIDTILEKASFTLSELLDEDEVIQECKSANEKLLDFLTTEAAMMDLIKFVSEMPEEEADDTVKVKFPYVASELLSSDVMRIYDALLDNDELCSKLFGFLGTDACKDAMLCGYFGKIVSALVMKKPLETLAKIREREVVPKLLANMSSYTMVDLLLRLSSLSQDPTVDMSGDELEWLAETGFVGSLVRMLEEGSTEEKSNAAAALVGLIGSLMLRDPKSVTSAVTSPDTVAKLFDYILVQGESASLQSLEVVVELMQKCALETEAAAAEATAAMNGEEPQPIEAVTVVVKEVIRRLPLLVAFVMGEPSEPRILDTTVGSQVKAFGIPRLRVVEILASLLRLQSSEAENALIEHRVINEFVKLLPQYPWHSIMHNRVLEMVSFGMQSEYLRTNMVSLGLLDSIVEASAQAEESTTHSMSYMAQIVRMALRVDDYASRDESLRQAVESHSAFKELVQQKVEPVKALSTKELAGGVSVGASPFGADPFPHLSADDEDSDDDDDVMDNVLTGADSLDGGAVLSLDSAGFANPNEWTANFDDDDDSFGIVDDEKTTETSETTSSGEGLQQDGKNAAIGGANNVASGSSGRPDPVRCESPDEEDILREECNRDPGSPDENPQYNNTTFWKLPPIQPPRGS